jgi:hypothetical protein
LPLTFIASQYATQKINTAGKNGFFVNLLLLMVGSVIALLVTAIPFIDHIKSDLIPHIKDDFAIASLSVNGGWQGWEFCIGLVLASVLYVSVMLATRANILWSYLSLLIAFSLCIPLLLAVYAPRIEEYSQKPAIEFYEELAHQDCYVETLGFKSYAQYYYTQCVPPTDRRYTDKYWLASGQADKPAYFVVKVNELHEYDALKLTEVKRKGGFVLLTKEKSNPTQP